MLDVFPMIVMAVATVGVAFVVDVGRGSFLRNLRTGVVAFAIIFAFNWVVGFRHLGPMPEKIEICRASNRAAYAAACPNYEQPPRPDR